MEKISIFILSFFIASLWGMQQPLNSLNSSLLHSIQLQLFYTLQSTDIPLILSFIKKLTDIHTQLTKSDAQSFILSEINGFIQKALTLAEQQIARFATLKELSTFAQQTKNLAVREMIESYLTPPSLPVRKQLPPRSPSPPPTPDASSTEAEWVMVGDYGSEPDPE